MAIPADVLRSIGTWQSGADIIEELGESIATDDLTMFAELPSYGSHSDRPSLPARTTPTVFVAGDGDCGRRSLEQLLTTTGFYVEDCGSADTVLALSLPAVPCCLVLLDVAPATNGLELQQQVRATMDLPIVFITRRAEVRVTVQAMKAGAVDVLTEPVEREQLVTAVATAMQLSQAALRRNAAMQQLRDCYASLTPREREVMGLVTTGLLNKQVALELGISEITVKVHRGQVMRKMKADSLPDLVKMAARLGRSVAHHEPRSANRDDCFSRSASPNAW